MPMSTSWLSVVGSPGCRPPKQQLMLGQKCCWSNKPAIGAGARQWTFIFMFQTQEQADAWRDSEIQRAWNERARELTEGEARIQVTCGLETWFTTPDLGVVAPPPRWKMAESTWLVIYPTITGLLLAVGPQLQPLPVALRTLVLTAVLVPLMPFVLMPSVPRALRGWLIA